MATIVFLDDVDEIIGSRRGLTFDMSQAGNYVKKRPSPINHQTNARMKIRSILKEANRRYWDMDPAKWILWAAWAQANDITGPWGQTKSQQGCAGYFSLIINVILAGESWYINPPVNQPLTGPTYTSLTRIDDNTVRAVFDPSPAPGTRRAYLRQALPGPGVRRWSAADGYIAEYSARNPNSPYDFTLKFPLLDGWHGRFWCSWQNAKGLRKAETLFDI